MPPPPRPPRLLPSRVWHGSGRDVIGSAQTGSGKTAAFALPILQALAADPYGVFALVLTPTRSVRRPWPRGAPVAHASLTRSRARPRPGPLRSSPRARPANWPSRSPSNSESWAKAST